jgi:hypothetical protein
MQQYCSGRSASLPSHHRMSSTSEDEATIDDSNENTWQEVKNTKRRKVDQPESKKT